MSETEATESPMPTAPGAAQTQVDAADAEEETPAEGRWDQRPSKYEPASCSKSESLPPGYMLVTVRLPSQSTPVMNSLPIEILPCHTFADVCALALARLPDVPRNYGLQAYLLLGQVEVPLQDPDTPARATLRSFPGATALRFDLTPGGPGAPRTAKVTRLGSRKQRPWVRRLVRVAIGFAKFVLAVEAAALVRGGVGSAVSQVARALGLGPDSEASSGGFTSEPAFAAARRRRGGHGRGSETENSEGAAEAAVMAVAEYVSGRGDVDVLMRHDKKAVLRALEEANTEVLEQFDVPNVAQTREAIKELVRELRQQEAQRVGRGPGGVEGTMAAATTASAARAAAGHSGAERGEEPRSGAAAGGEEVGAAAGEGFAPRPPEAEALPGFGPGKATGPKSGGGGKL